MKKFGLQAILSFIDKGATAAMGRIGRVARGLQAKFRGVGAAVGRVSANLARFAAASIPVAAAFGFMLKKGADFEQAFQRVRAVLLDTTGKATKGLEGLAQTLGATTVFSASEAAKAMEALARAGLSTNQIMGAIRGTLSAAAAEGIGLAAAADVVASSIAAFGLAASKAGTIAGSLALVSAKTNTAILGLKEGLKLAAPAAKLAGVSFKDTALALGTLANVGLKGSLAGTAFRAAITKLTKPTKDVSRGLGKLGLSIKQVNTLIDKGKTIQAFRLIGDRLLKVKKNSARAGIAMKIFGVRGAAVGSAFGLTGQALVKFNALVKKLGKESGQTAKQMAKIQLATVAGQAKLLKSALEAVSIQIFKLAAPALGGAVKGLATTLGDFALAMRVVSGAKFTDEKEIKKVSTLSDSMLLFAEGVKGAFTKVRDVLRDVGKFFGKLITRFKALPEDTQRKIAKIGVALGLLVTVVGPLLAGFGLFVTLAGSAIGVFTALLSPFIAIPAALAAITVSTVGPARAFQMLKDLFGKVKAVFSGLVTGFLETKAFTSIKNAVISLFSALGSLVSAIFGVSGTTGSLQSFGEDVGMVFGTLLKIVAFLVDKLAKVINLAVKAGKFVTALSPGSAFLEIAKRREAQARGEKPPPASTFVGSFKPLANLVKAVAGVRSKPPTLTAAPKPAKDALVSSTGFLPVSAGDVVLDRASLAGAIVSQLRGGLRGRVGDGALGGGTQGQTSPAPSSGGGPIRIEVPVMLSGREIALAVAEVQLDDLERSGAVLRAGDRSALLQRGFREET